MPEKAKDDVQKGLQKEVDRILDYLNKLSSHYDLYQHRPDELRDVSVQSYYTMVARKVQNQAVSKLKTGFETGDPETFLDGIRRFEEAAKILDLGIENPEESAAFYQEMINLFLKFIKDSSDSVGRFEPKGLFFKLKSFEAVAEVLENVMGDFSKAAGYRNQAATYEKRWKKTLQYIYIIFDLVLAGNFEGANGFLAQFDNDGLRQEIASLAMDDDAEAQKQYLEALDAFKSLGAVIIGANEKRTADSINVIIDKINELRARGVPITLVTLQKFTQKLATSLGFTDIVQFKSDEQVSLEQLKPPMPPKEAGARAQAGLQPPVSAALSQQITENMGAEMQNIVERAQAVHDGTADLSLNSVDAIKKAISDGMAGLASEIVNQLSSKLGGMSFGGGGGMAMSGPMRNLDGPGGGPPQIQSLGKAKPTERPQRPKLSEMLDSVIVED
ncbi:MAG: hypothetical protein GYA24_04445 [Candidatus Lokiarchaeota archaeon]|nr:hypothetical protein [Candidatus Lokiarchaeota archaeon]